MRGSWTDVDPSSLDAAFVILEGPWSNNALTALQRLAGSDTPGFFVLGDRLLPPEILDVAASRLGEPDTWMEPEVAELRPARSHPIFTDAGGFFADSPPPPIPRGPYRPGSGQTLATVAHDGRDLPTLIASSQSPRTLALYAGGLAVWDLARRGSDPGAEGMIALLDRTLRWLTGGGAESRITVRADQELFHAGETARLSASVADAGLNPVETARVTATITRQAAGGSRDDDADDDNPSGSSARDAGNSRTVEFQGLGGGRYAAQTLPWGEGRYTVETTIETDQETVTRTAEFVVDRFDLEAAERRMRPDRLRALADATGGSVLLSPTDLDSLPALLPHATEWVERRGAWKPFGLWLTLLLVTAVLGVEWLVRTRTGMA